MNDELHTTLGARDLVGLGGLTLACVVVGLALGWLVDDWLGSTPAFVLLGLGLGVAASCVGTWIRVRAFLRQ